MLVATVAAPTVASAECVRSRASLQELI